MSAFKKLPQQDVFVSDYQSRRRWALSGSLLNDLGVQYMVGYSGSKPGFPYPQDTETTRGGYNYYSSKLFDTIYTQFYADSLGNGIFSGSRDISRMSTITYSGSRDIRDTIMAVSIPQNLLGTQVEPYSFVLQPEAGDLDDYIEEDYVRDKWCGRNDYVENGSTVYGTKPPPDDPDYIISESVHTENSVGLKRFDSQSFVSESSELQYVAPDDFIRQEIVDDGDGNLIFSGSDLDITAPRRHLGDIIYNQGLAIVTDKAIAQHYTAFSAGQLSFRSNLPIYTYNVYCRLRDSEFNHTYNPSAISGSRGDLHSHVTGSDFSPYITTVGLYNEANELLAVGKLNKPVKKLTNTDMTLLVQIDI